MAAPVTLLQLPRPQDSHPEIHLPLLNLLLETHWVNPLPCSSLLSSSQTLCICCVLFLWAEALWSRGHVSDTMPCFVFCCSARLAQSHSL